MITFKEWSCLPKDEYGVRKRQVVIEYDNCEEDERNMDKVVALVDFLQKGCHTCKNGFWSSRDDMTLCKLFVKEMNKKYGPDTCKSYQEKPVDLSEIIGEVQ